MYNKNDLLEVKKIILSELSEIEYILLFGSYAKQNANEDSDLDIAVILQKLPNWRMKKNILNRIYQKTSDLNLDVDFILKNLSDYRNEINLPTLSKTINEEGVILWKREN